MISLKNKKALAILLVLILTFVFIPTTTVLARDNYAISIGTTAGGINTIQDANDASNAYRNVGYTSYGISDPTRQRLWENLYADVQFFSTHGNVGFINFSSSGIRVGSSNSIYVGTDDVHWDTDTILVTYSSCYGAGNKTLDTNSIAFRTCQEGADVTVGFRDEINPGSSTNWNKRYNDKLASGSGVFDAVKHANSYIYLYPSVKDNTVYNHGNDNIKIGRYRSYSNPVDKRNILNNSSTIDNYSLMNKADTNTISTYIKNYYPNFDINNYNVISRDGLISTNINTNESKQIKYIDYQFKIGDFVTEAGFTAELEDNKIKAIYDNNIDINKQETMLKMKSNFNANLNKSNISNMKNKAIMELQSKYSDTDIAIKNASEIEALYYYDIENDQKYIVCSVPTYLTSDTGEVGIAYDTVMYKI